MSKDADNDADDGHNDSVESGDDDFDNDDDGKIMIMTTTNEK